MKALKFFLPIFSTLLIAAHFSRIQNDLLALGCLLLPLILLSKKEWVMRLYQSLLVCGSLIWMHRTIELVDMRTHQGRDWLRLAIILGAVSLFTLVSVWVFESKKIKSIFSKAPGMVAPPVAAFWITFHLLSIVQLVVKKPVMLLAERFVPGGGWLEILVLSLYAAWVVEKMADPDKSPTIRRRIWILFSVVFFLQLILGLAGIEKLLMTGKLHLPVPALIIAGPLFRGGGYLMLILFGATLLLVGPAWCSYLCYIGAWDNAAAALKKNPTALPRWRHAARFGILMLIIIMALLLRFTGVSPVIAAWLAAVFGLAGVGIMVFISRKKGTMVHCIAYCPIGLVADVVGKISPFRFRINHSCTGCGACRAACRYEALTEADIEKRKPGITCTLCGDCISHCKYNAFEYKFFGMSAEAARYFFIVVAVSLHAVFMAVARL